MFTITKTCLRAAGLLALIMPLLACDHPYRRTVVYTEPDVIIYDDGYETVIIEDDDAVIVEEEIILYDDEPEIVIIEDDDTVIVEEEIIIYDDDHETIIIEEEVIIYDD